ncbi:DUF1634 domain-containing protein [Chitinophaga qingshengii]|uniref:DUF1634 domain-containing protein n=1 Tax=Chitinophaga qingshengii TaxID=1569794 RepID=A0ABR7TGH1_9BACT|nr:DUF1634 domain-containing protein [Chitinophaga qingshengii]MBC9929552.1 DUF1634 domain-containing protein [Chitinophaga qingshengii]
MKLIRKLTGDRDIALFVGQVLRTGVISASAIAFVGGVMYLSRHGADSMPDYSTFTGEGKEYTTFSGIFRGLATFKPSAVIQFGALILLATPILRVFFSLVGFAVEKDRLYVVITLIVLGIILFSMFGGLKV